MSGVSADNLLFLSRFLCSEEDEGFCTEPVANNQTSSPLGFYFTQKVLPLLAELNQLVWHYYCMLGCVHIYQQNNHDLMDENPIHSCVI